MAQAVQEAGEVPVWACGETNSASFRVAQKLGFEPIEHKTYVIRGKQEGAPQNSQNP